jgi:hypothetical protein
VPPRFSGPRDILVAVDMKLRILLFVPLLAVGVVSFVIVRSQQGEGATLVARQQNAEALTATAVERVVRVAPESLHGAGGRSADCVQGARGELRNPWQCTIRYADGKLVSYRVTINADGSYTGDDQRVTYQGRTVAAPGQISGCCIAIP